MNTWDDHHRQCCRNRTGLGQPSAAANGGRWAEGAEVQQLVCCTNPGVGCTIPVRLSADLSNSENEQQEDGWKQSQDFHFRAGSTGKPKNHSNLPWSETNLYYPRYFFLIRKPLKRRILPRPLQTSSDAFEQIGSWTVKGLPCLVRAHSRIPIVVWVRHLERRIGKSVVSDRTVSCFDLVSVAP